MKLKTALCALLLSIPSISQSAPGPWISGNFGGSLYSMNDVNDDIGNINAQLAGSGLSMEEITKGPSLGVAAGIDLPNGFGFGIGFDRLPASSDVSDASAAIEYNMPANLVRAFGRYSFSNTGQTRGFVEASVGRITTVGDVRVSVLGSGSVSADLEGSGLAIEGCMGGEHWTTPQFALTGSAGFRHAKSSKVTVDNTPIYTASGEDYTVDYSGLFVRLGLKVVFSK